MTNAGGLPGGLPGGLALDGSLDPAPGITGTSANLAFLWATGLPPLPLQIPNPDATAKALAPSGPSAIQGCAWWDLPCNLGGTINAAGARIDAAKGATIRDWLFILGAMIVLFVGVWRLSS
jgi:hypothetical protein